MSVVVLFMINSNSSSILVCLGNSSSISNSNSVESKGSNTHQYHSSRW